MKKAHGSRSEAAGSEWDGEDKYRHLFETLSQGVVFHALDGSIVSANPAACRLLGLTQDQLLGKTSLDPRWRMITPEGESVLGAEHPSMQVLRTGHPVGPVVRGVFRPDKQEYIWLSITAVPIFRKGEPGPFQVYATFDDITERKRAEEDRLEIEHKFRLLFESMTSGFALHEIILDRDGKPCDYRFLQVNPAFEALTGLKAATVLGKTVLQIFPRTEKEWIERYGRVATTGESVLFENYSRELGRHFQVMAYRPEPGHFAVIVNDITEQKRAYEKVKQEQNLNNVIIDSIPGSFYMFDETGKFVRWNTYERDELVGKPEDQMAQANALDTIHPEDRGFIQSRIAHVLQAGGVETVEGRILLRGGPEFRWFLLTGRQLVVDGHPYLVGIGTDITERKRVDQEMAQIRAELEAKVRERTADLNEAQRIAHMGSWHLDLATEKVTWSEELYRIYRFDPSQPVPSYPEHQKYFMPESWERLTTALARTSEKGVPYEMELEMVIEEGKPAWMWVRGEAVRDAQGKIVGLRGVSQDITERQVVAAELFKAYAALEDTIARRTSELSLANSALKTEISVRRRAEGDLQQRTKELQVKNRHLECLYELAHVIEKHGERKKALCLGLIPLLQQAILRPVSLHVFVEMDDISVSSPAAGEEWVQEGTFPICVNGRNRGAIRLARRPREPAVPLTADEVNLLGAVTERLGRLVVWFDALREAQERQLHLIQADKLASLGVMVAGVAHEINNPVNNIMLNASLLRDVVADALPILDDHRNRVGDFPAGGLLYSEMRNHIGELMNGILEGSERIKTITGDLRDSVPSNVEMSRESAEVNEVVATAVRMCSHMDKHFRERMVLSLAEGLPRVPGSHRRLEQVVINLIQNAWQALQSPEARIYVDTRMDFSSGAVVVEVRDEGCGMSPEVLAHIKDPFFTTRRDQGGTGLGISVSNGIVEEMGGSLKFESAEGKGTVACIHLPVQKESRGNP